MKIYTKNEILQVLDWPYLMNEIELGFVLRQFINGPVSFLNFPKGDVHIKSGAILDDELYVVKIASGFYVQTPTTNGAMLLFSQKTGELICILHDEGCLTNIRTGLAGAIVAKYLAPTNPQVGIIGTGTQAKEQLRHLPQKDALVWGRDPEKTEKFASEMNVKAASSIDEITETCNLIVTTTPSTKPLLFGHQIRPGTHITAIGADNPGKQELDASLFEKADLIVTDNLEQARTLGDLSHAKNLDLSKVVELGNWISAKRCRDPSWITVADLTGIAALDLQIAKAVYQRLNCLNAR